MSKAGTLKRAAKELANPVAKQVKRKKFVYDGEVWDFQVYANNDVINNANDVTSQNMT